MPRHPEVMVLISEKSTKYRINLKLKKLVMISKSTAKFIKSLQIKKYRKKEQSFLVEGKKSVLEVLSSDYEVKQLFVTEQFLLDHPALNKNITINETTANQLSAVGTLKNNDSALAVVSMKAPVPVAVSPNEWIIALDNINDPGNLGTILRIADWYGIKKIVASEETADFYNPKVIAASKGSFCRVQLHYVDLVSFLKDVQLPVYGAMMNGEDVHDCVFGESGILTMGNEATGISSEVSALIANHITIPRYGGAESLNVAMATAIICDNIKRNRNQAKG